MSASKSHPAVSAGGSQQRRGSQVGERAAHPNQELAGEKLKISSYKLESYRCFSFSQQKMRLCTRDATMGTGLRCDRCAEGLPTKTIGLWLEQGFSALSQRPQHPWQPVRHAHSQTPPAESERLDCRSPAGTLRLAEDEHGWFGGTHGLHMGGDTSLSPLSQPEQMLELIWQLQASWWLSSVSRDENQGTNTRSFVICSIAKPFCFEERLVGQSASWPLKEDKSMVTFLKITTPKYTGAVLYKGLVYVETHCSPSPRSKGPWRPRAPASPSSVTRRGISRVVFTKGR